MALVFLGLGTNLGDKEQNLTEAIRLLAMNVGPVICRSAFYASAPWGFESKNHFLNAVVLVNTHLSPAALLAKTQSIERELGRTTKSVDGYSDRLIDIDILLYDDLIVNETALKIPHPLITERDFVLMPLLEIAPELVNPFTGKKYKEYVRTE